MSDYVIRDAEDVIFTQCQGCISCQARAKRVAVAYLRMLDTSADRCPFHDDGVPLCAPLDVHCTCADTADLVTPDPDRDPLCQCQGCGAWRGPAGGAA